MLKPAINYVDQLTKLRSIIFDNEDKYKYYINNDYINYKTLTVEDSDWNYIQRVSVNEKDEVQGYLSATLNPPFSITNLGFINFYLNSKKLQMSFVRDMLSFIDYLFTYRNLQKIEWCVIIGNPAERLYDKFIKKFNGRVVGTFTKSKRLFDGNVYDVKWYELMRDDYIKAKNVNSISN